MASRDEIVAFADALLDASSFADHCPNGLQVPGADEVERIVCGVSSSLELFRRAEASGSTLVLVHHGLFWDRDPRAISPLLRQRLRVLFDANLSLLAYHLPLDAHPELGNNALLARLLDAEPDGPFAGVGLTGRLRRPAAIGELAARLAGELDRDPLVFAAGPDLVRRLAICSGGAASALPEAVAAGCDCFLTGEAAEPTMMAAREAGIHVIAAGHYATETLGVRALAAAIAERFGVEWEFADLPNPV